MTRITQRTTAALRDEYRLLVPDKEDIVWALCDDVEELLAWARQHTLEPLSRCTLPEFMREMLTE